MTGLRVVRPTQSIQPPRNTRVWQTVGRSDIGDGAVALGLIHMVRHLTDRDNTAGLAMNPGDVDDICDGLPVGAHDWDRIRALQVIAEHHADWTATPQGRDEVKRLIAWIAPRCPEQTWAQIVGETVLAADQTLNRFDRAVAEQNLYCALNDAIHATAPGPEAA